MSKRAKKQDTEYFPEENESKHKKAKLNAMQSDELRQFLAVNKEFIKSSIEQGLTPHVIAGMLNTKIGRPGAVSNTQISKWVYAQKKTKQVKPPSVSLKNGNLKASSCM